MDIKRITYLILSLLTLVISISSLQASQFLNLSNTIDSLGLKGSIKTLNHNSNISGKQTFEFDDSGYLRKAIFLYPNIEQDASEADNANLSGHQRIYVYGEHKKLLEIRKEPLNTTESMSEGIKYHYYKKENTPHSSLEDRPLTRDVTRLFFDDRRLSEEVVVLMTKGKLLPEINKYTYQYDQHGLIKLTTKQMLNTKTRQRILRNDKGFMTEARFGWNDLHGNHEVKFSYKYLDFDKYENWTKRIITISDGGDTEVQTREITYYNES